MKKPSTNRAAHFSVVWGVTLAIITLVEWSSLGRDPLNHEILSPFFDRHVAVTVEREQAPAATEIPGLIEPDDVDAALRYEVSLDFNGPLFLASFFIPVLIFHGVGLLWRRKRSD